MLYKVAKNVNNCAFDVSDCPFHSSVHSIRTSQALADQALAPLLGIQGFCVLALSQRDYLELVDQTGREIHPGKRGSITGPPPAALSRLGHSAKRCQSQVQAVGNGYVRAIGAAELLIEKSRDIGHFWLRVLSCARRLEAAH